MRRIRLQTQLFFAALLIVGGLLLVFLIIIRHSIQTGMRRQVRQSSGALVQAFAVLQQQRRNQLMRTAAMLAQVPPLEALMTTRDPATIQDASARFWRLSSADLFALADANARVMAIHCRGLGAERNRFARVIARNLRENRDAGWNFFGDRLFQFAAYPIAAGSPQHRIPLGWVIVGFQADSAFVSRLARLADSQIALVSSRGMIATTLPHSEMLSFLPLLRRGGLVSGMDGRPIQLGNHAYQAIAAPIQKRPEVTGYVLKSLDSMRAFLRSLNRILLLIGLLAIGLAALLFGLVARATTRPLDMLLAGVRALAHGDYAYALEPRGSSEVAELSDAFAKMRLELQAAQLRWKEAERIAAVGQAASSLSHDLRHYMAVVLANVEFLYDTRQYPEGRDEIYAEIESASRQMIGLCDSLLDLARTDSHLAPGPGSLDKTLRRAVQTAQSSLEREPGKIEVRLRGDMEGFLDWPKIERVFVNLLKNACEASPQGKIAITVVADELHFTVRLADEGPGIPAAIRQTLFDPFISQGKPHGTGLGLAIVARIVQEHGGTVSVERSSPQGAIFLLRLPRRIEPRREMQPGTRLISQPIAAREG